MVFFFNSGFELLHLRFSNASLFSLLTFSEVTEDST